MRWRALLILSLIVNLLLAAGWLFLPRKQASANDDVASLNTKTNTITKTAVIVRRQFFSWQEIESQDYAAYIKNLREIGCPEQTIRDLIIADVTQMLREKHVQQLPGFKPNPKWWTNRRDPGDTVAESNKNIGFGEERMAILNQLLGEEWNIRNRPELSRTNDQHDLIIATMDASSVLRGLTVETKKKIADLLKRKLSPADSALPSRYAVAPSEITPTPFVAEKETWLAIAGMLSPAQFDEVKLRFAAHAENLREELDSLPGFDTQPEEFRKIFAATEEFDLQIRALANRDDPEAQVLRQKLTAQMEAATRASLDPQRFEQYARLLDPDYLDALELLDERKGKPAALATLYAINRESSSEKERIATDDKLTETQRQIELKKIELEQIKATALALGETLLEEPSTQPPPKAEPKKTHSVAGGESLERIAQIYGVDKNALRAANPNLNFDKLKRGDQVSVPLNLIYPLPPPN
jgi:hypothetical protein